MKQLQREYEELKEILQQIVIASRLLGHEIAFSAENSVSVITKETVLTIIIAMRTNDIAFSIGYMDTVKNLNKSSHEEKVSTLKDVLESL